jgi:hypothetical protein
VKGYVVSKKNLICICIWLCASVFAVSGQTCTTWLVSERHDCIVIPQDWGNLTDCDFERTVSCLFWSNPGGGGGSDDGNPGDGGPLRCNNDGTGGIRPEATFEPDFSWMEDPVNGFSRAIPENGRWGNAFQIQGNIDPNNHRIEDTALTYGSPNGDRRIPSIGSPSFSVRVQTQMSLREDGAFSPFVEMVTSKPFCQNHETVTVGLGLTVAMKHYGKRYSLDFVSESFGDPQASFIYHHQSACPAPYSETRSYQSTRTLQTGVTLGTEEARFVGQRLSTETETITRNYQFQSGQYGRVAFVMKYDNYTFEGFEYDWLAQKHTFLNTTVTHEIKSHQQFTYACD